MSDREGFSPYNINTISTQYQVTSDDNEEKKYMKELLVDPIPSPSNSHHNNCQADRE